jgi:simple sugar transport system ATP-binding protein
MALVRMDNIVKRFGAVTALDGASLEVEAGEVHALLGENGAGKTTLMRILAGRLSPDAGEVWLDGKRITRFAPQEAQRHGVAMVAQNFTLVLPLTADENLRLALRDRRAIKRAKEFADELGWQLRWDAEVAALSVGERQRLEILKALAVNPRVLILDEPTSVLTPTETDALFGLLRRFVAADRTVIVITHRLSEVAQVADRVTVLRQGRKIATVPATTPTDELARLMVGEAMVTETKMSRGQVGEVVLEVRDLWVRGDDGRWVVKGVGFTVRSGEIVGIAGVDGNGQQELVEAIWGLRRWERGEIRFGDAKGFAMPREWWRNGAAFLPSDPMRRMAVLAWSLTRNAALRRQVEEQGWWLHWAKVRAMAEAWRQRFGVRAPSVETALANLSGGNRQRWALAMALAEPKRLFVLVNPTQGLDVASTKTVHELLNQLRAEGAAILLVSTDLEEVLTLSDRVLVMFAGQLREAERQREIVGALMGGVGFEGEQGVTISAAN